VISLCKNRVEKVVAVASNAIHTRAHLIAKDDDVKRKPSDERTNERVAMHGREISLDEAAVAVRRGAKLVKYCRNAKPHFVFVQLSADASALTWVGKREKEKSISFVTVERVLSGQHTELFRKRRGEHDVLKSFSIVYEDASGASSRTLDLVCDNENQRNLWVFALEHLVHRAQRHAQVSGFGEITQATSASTQEERGLSGVKSSTALTVALAASKFKKRASLRERQGGLSHDFGAAEPSEVYSWGWQPDVSRRDTGSETTGSGFTVQGARWKRIDEPSLVEGMETLDVVDVAIGARHTMVQTRSGVAYSWGEGKGGKLGHPNGQDAELPLRVELEGRVIGLACGSAHSLAITEDVQSGGDSGGDVCVWGDPNAVPGLLGRPEARNVMWFPGKISFVSSDMTAIPRSSSLTGGAKVVHVACGPCHTACVTETGRCYTWGEGSFHALGHGSRSSEYAPRLLESLQREGRVVLRVACGIWHTAAIVAKSGSNVTRVPPLSHNAEELDSLEGELFTWGDGETGQLGISGVDVAVTPTRTSGQLGKPGSEVCDVSCGQHHTLALTSQGDLWLAGCVGRVDNSMKVGVFTRIPDFETGSVQAASSGDNHVVATTRDNRVFAWGVGKNGRLGLGRNDRDQAEPQEIVALRGRTILRVSCGPTSSACIVRAMQMTRKEKASMARLSTLSKRSFKVIEPSEKVGSNVESGSNSSYSTKRDGRSGTDSRSRNGGNRANQGLRSEKMAHRLLSVLSPTFEDVPKTSSRVGSAPIMPLAESMQPLKLEYRNSKPEATVPIAKPDRRAPEPVATEPSKPAPIDAPDVRGFMDETPRANRKIDGEASDLERARVEAEEAKAALARLLDEKAILQAATDAALAKQRREEEEEAKPPPVVEPTLPQRIIRKPIDPRRVRGETIPIGAPREWVEEVENGVFMTLEAHGDETLLKRVRFSKRIFSNELAQQWWEENRVRVIRDRGLTVPQ